MATSPTTGPSTGTVQAHVSSLVAKSQQALQHGELLCLRASELSASSAQSAADMLALDAKVRWITNAVLEQLQLAAHVAKSIEQKRSLLEKQVEEWETLRNQRADALDAILESLGTQVVPPEFHSSSPDSSPFGSQQNSDGEHEDGAPFGDPDPQPGQSPTETLRNGSHHLRAAARRNADRTRWKTLRDFVDERAIEDVLDTIESDHNALDDVLARTADYPESLSSTISVIRRTVPVELPLPSVEDIFSSQETARTKMAGQLESLVQHLGEMEGALKDILAGEEFDDEDLQAMNRDTEELPVIVAELEESMASINASHEQLTVAKRLAQEHLDTHRRTLDDLDELGDIMYEMLERQEAVETESTEHLVVLHHHLVTIDDLHHRFTSYQYSYNRLVLELARRQQYREAAQKIVEGMLAQLDAMTEGEHPPFFSPRVLKLRDMFLERNARRGRSSARSTGNTSPRTCVSAYRMHPHGGRSRRGMGSSWRCCQILTVTYWKRQDGRSPEWSMGWVPVRVSETDTLLGYLLEVCVSPCVCTYIGYLTLFRRPSAQYAIQRRQDDYYNWNARVHKHEHRGQEVCIPLFINKLLHEFTLPLVTHPFGHTIGYIHNALTVEYMRGRLEVKRHLVVEKSEGGWKCEDGFAALVEKWGAADIAGNFAGYVVFAGARLRGEEVQAVVDVSHHADGSLEKNADEIDTTLST